MTPEEVSGLLRYASTLDPWLGATSQEEAAVMVTGWANMLQGVDAAVAMAAVTEHYAEEGARSIQPGDVLAAWKRNQRAALTGTEREQAVEARARSAAEVVAGMGGSLGTYLRACQDAIREGRDVSTVPLPENRPRLDPHTDQWQRRCSFPNICACSHTECRAGFLDAETQVVDTHGRAHPAVKRCPVCADGILMAQERGLARRPSRHSRR